jgi:hypothetical protein
MAERYFLTEDAYVCASSGHAVFLDLRSGRYMTLHERAAKSLSRHVVGWPMSGDAAERDDASPLLAQLLRKGLLTAEPAASNRSNGATVAPPAETLLDSIHLREPVIRAHHVMSFLICAYRARVLIKFRGIKAVIERVRRRRVTTPPREDLTTLTAIFHRLQPLALDGRDGCLLHSFALLEFLAGHGHRVQWVFAVRAVPFSAHCWLQQGSVVINDVTQRAGYLSPILVV